jgi:hypothetical protein
MRAAVELIQFDNGRRLPVEGALLLSLASANGRDID